MTAELVTVGFCPQYYSRFRVLSSGISVTYYEVDLHGAESAPHCTCPAFRFSGGYGEQDCKHVRLVWEHGCLWNPQWKDAGPNDLAAHGIEVVGTDPHNVIKDSPCPGCGQDCVAVRIAV